MTLTMSSSLKIAASVFLTGHERKYSLRCKRNQALPVRNVCEEAKNINYRITDTNQANCFIIRGDHSHLDTTEV